MLAYRTRIPFTVWLEQPAEVIEYSIEIMLAEMKAQEDAHGR